MIKRILSVIAAVALLTPVVSAWYPQEVATPSISQESPQVCQFSLSKYTGNISSSGWTENFTVGLSCPQESDIYATVVVFIDETHVASEVIKVAAGKTRSESTYISVGASYSGKRYNLVVQ